MGMKKIMIFVFVMAVLAATTAVAKKTPKKTAKSSRKAVAEAVQEVAPEGIPDLIIGDSTEEISEDVAERAAAEVPAKVPEEIVEEIPGKVPEEAVDESGEEAMEDSGEEIEEEIEEEVEGNAKEKSQKHLWCQPVLLFTSDDGAEYGDESVPSGPEGDWAETGPALEEPEAEPGVAAERRWRYEVGVRCLGVWLTEDRKGEQGRGSFIGSIYKLKARQNWWPIHPYAQATYAMGDNWRLGLGATFSHVEVQTLDDGGGDGDAECNALMGYVVAEMDIDRFRPYAAAGGGVSFNSFDPTDEWGANNTREFDLDNSPAFFAGAGCAVGLVAGLSLDAHVRYVHCDVDGTYIYRRDHRSGRDFTFTTSYIAAGVGLSYAF